MMQIIGFQLSFSQVAESTAVLIKPAYLFDGTEMHKGWALLIEGNRIKAVGAAVKEPPGAKIIEMPGATLLPGLIEGHSHLFLHPYNEVSWNDQVMHESRAERTARAVIHARKTLLAGFTTARDLGTESAMYDDVGLKTAIEKGIIPGPRLLVATRAIVATGSYGPDPGNADLDLPKGAAEADGVEGIIKEARTQIGKGADLVKVYADYRWGPDHSLAPTFSEAELKALVKTAESSGRFVAAHASSAEGVRRAIAAGVRTIEHADEAGMELFQLMKENGIAYCPTLAASEAIATYHGWRKGIDPDPEHIVQKKKSFKEALKAGVKICMGGDVGVFPHGDNVREMELMAEYGMPVIDVLRSATTVNAGVFGLSDRLGRLAPGMLADVIAVSGNPAQNISDLRRVIWVMKDGKMWNPEK